MSPYVVRLSPSYPYLYSIIRTLNIKDVVQKNKFPPKYFSPKKIKDKKPF